MTIFAQAVIAAWLATDVPPNLATERWDIRYSLMLCVFYIISYTNNELAFYCQIDFGLNFRECLFFKHNYI